MKIGILGGTFDPVHYGHLLMAEICREELQLDEVRFLPAGNPPHKPDRRISDAHARADMLQLAVSGYPEYTVDRREIRREGPSYTVDTLTEFRAQLPDAELFFLMGADSLHDFLTWKDPEKISELATIVAVNRPGWDLPSVDSVKELVGEKIATNVTLVQMPGADLSASELRRRISSGLGLRFMTPRAVEAYLVQHSIYADLNR